MIYITLEENLEETNKKIKFFKKRFFKLKNKYSKLKEERFENLVLITLPNIEEYTLNKLLSYIKIKCVNRVCISDSLANNTEFIEFINSQQIKICDGKWLFQYLMYQCAEYIILCKKERLEYQEISILSNSISSVLIDSIYELASKIKILNIITEYENRFRKIEKELYEKKGILLNINNNYQKGLIKSDIIFNFDFSEEELNKYVLPKKGCIINFNNDIKINSKAFEGINSNFYDIQMPQKYLKNSVFLKDFNNVALYESYIYKKTSPQNIKDEIKKDEISITFLNGKNGKIRKNEYLNLSKKVAN